MLCHGERSNLTAVATIPLPLTWPQDCFVGWWPPRNDGMSFLH